MPIVVVVIIRSVIGFFLLLLLIKMIGKQQVTQLTFFDYTVGITIGSIASTLSVQVNENSWSTMVGMAVWSLLALLLAFLGLKSPYLRKMIEGIAQPVIKNGKIQVEILRQNKISNGRTDGPCCDLRMCSTWKMLSLRFWSKTGS